jgi:hypothetical protein
MTININNTLNIQLNKASRSTVSGGQKVHLS